MPDQPTVVDTTSVIDDIRRLHGEMLAWADGHLSTTNYIHEPAVSAVMDAQEVVKRAAAIEGSVAVLRAMKEGLL